MGIRESDVRYDPAGFWFIERSMFGVPYRVEGNNKRTVLEEANTHFHRVMSARNKQERLETSSSASRDGAL